MSETVGAKTIDYAERLRWITNTMNDATSRLVDVERTSVKVDPLVDDVEELKTKVSTNVAGISELKTSTSTNATNIAGLRTDVDTNRSDITSLNEFTSKQLTFEVDEVQEFNQEDNPTDEG